MTGRVARRAVSSPGVIAWASRAGLGGPGKPGVGSRKPRIRCIIDFRAIRPARVRPAPGTCRHQELVGTLARGPPSSPSLPNIAHFVKPATKRGARQHAQVTSVHTRRLARVEDGQRAAWCRNSGRVQYIYSTDSGLSGTDGLPPV